MDGHASPLPSARSASASMTSRAPFRDRELPHTQFMTLMLKCSLLGAFVLVRAWFQAAFMAASPSWFG